jgi:hypothetical protein
MKKLFVQWNVSHNKMKYWFGGACWDMVNCMCEHVLKIIQSVVVGDRFVFLSVNDVITIDNRSWISIHVYVMQAWKKLHVFIFQCVVGGSNVDNLTLVVTLVI